MRAGVHRTEKQLEQMDEAVQTLQRDLLPKEFEKFLGNAERDLNEDQICDSRAYQPRERVEAPFEHKEMLERADDTTRLWIEAVIRNGSPSNPLATKGFIDGIGHRHPPKLTDAYFEKCKEWQAELANIETELPALQQAKAEALAELNKLRDLYVEECQHVQ